MDMRRRFVQMQNGGHDVILPEGLVEPRKVIGAPLVEFPFGLDTLHIIVRTGKHNADYLYLVLSYLSCQPGVCQPIIDRLRPVGHAFRECDQFPVQVRARRVGIRGHLRPRDVGCHRRFVTRRLI